jgi:hypothetical protein
LGCPIVLIGMLLGFIKGMFDAGTLLMAQFIAQVMDR